MKTPAPPTPTKAARHTPEAASVVRAEWLPRAVTGLVFAVHTAGLAMLFGPVSGLWSSQPVIEQDWGTHYHHLTSLAAFWRDGRSLWGYDPLFMAGHPSNTIQDASVKLFELGALALGGDSPVRAFKLLACLGAAVWPLLLHAAARNLFGRHRGSLWVAPVAAILGTASWWNSYPREMFFYGMIGFPAASAVALWALSLLTRVLSERPVFWAYAALPFALAALLPLHLQGFALLASVGFAAAVLHTSFGSPRSPAARSGGARDREPVNSQERIDRRKTGGPGFPFPGIAFVIAALLFGMIVNLPWLLPFLTHRGDDISGALLREVSYFKSDSVWTFARDYATGEAFFTFRKSVWEKGLRLALLALGVMGIFRLWRSGSRVAAAMLTAGASLCFAAAYFGSLQPSLAAQQPLRFKVPLDLFLTLAAAWALVGRPILDPAAARGRTPRRSRPTAPLAASRSWLPVGFALAGLLAFAVNLAATESKGNLRLRTRLPERLEAIVQWARERTPPDARILFEESGDESGFRYDGVYLSSFLAHLAGRELIGGPANVYNDRHHHAEFHSGRLLGRPVGSFTDDQLHAVFDAYNIGAAVVFDRHSAERLLGCPGLVRLDRRVGPFLLLRAMRTPSWFSRGEGRLEARPGTIRCTNVRGDEVVLKYHLIEGLRSTPPLRLLPERVLDDPIPFIRIERPSADFELHRP